MIAQHPAYLFSEGKISLPAHYLDRTVNQFIPTVAAPAINISRDALTAGQDLATYISDQLNALAPHMPGFTQHERSVAQLGATLLAGEVIHVSFMRDNQRICQMQAIFNIGEGRILIFSMTKIGALVQADQQQFSEMLASFSFHQAQA